MQGKFELIGYRFSAQIDRIDPDIPGGNAARDVVDGDRDTQLNVIQRDDDRVEIEPEIVDDRHERVSAFNSDCREFPHRGQRLRDIERDRRDDSQFQRNVIIQIDADLSAAERIQLHHAERFGDGIAGVGYAE